MYLETCTIPVIVTLTSAAFIVYQSGWTMDDMVDHLTGHGRLDVEPGFTPYGSLSGYLSAVY